MYLGKIELGTIENFLEVSGTAKDLKSINELKLEHIRYVFYPDCQQLIIWLPNPGSNYSDLRIYNLDQKLEIRNDKVQNILSGSIQIILDSTTFIPASYMLELEWPQSIKHKIYFLKLEDGISPKEISKTSELPVSKNESLHDRRRYYDSSGNLIPDDIDFREEKMKELIKLFDQKIEYEEAGRAGTIIYVNGDLKIKFDYEFGGGNCFAIIMIPNEQNWETVTGISLSERKDIIEYLATTVHWEKLPTSRIDITSDSISFYSE